ncbi:ABC transporter ATP-binding protein [Bradyrhizobium ganzhouense]|uniref:ABC transporter ATP-binding protein n=1 Tax=Bradyrhizobium ganzhouense TaxID=1179767 RepID=UPI003CF00053
MILELKSVRASYGRIPVLHHIDMFVAEGECVGLWGPNGMGKTSLLKTILGYLPATAGSIKFMGEDVTPAATHVRARKGLGLVPQGRQIFPALTVLENLRMGAALSGEDGRHVIEEVLEHFPRLKMLLERTGGLLSGGEQQLLALARCLCGRPKLMMLDEPTEGIQPSINEEIAETLQNLISEKKLAMIVVEQKREFLAALSKRVLLMQKGLIAREMTAAELLAHDTFH